MDYFLLPTGIHELLAAKDDGQATAKMLKELIYDGNRTDGIIKQEGVQASISKGISRKGHTADVWHAKGAILLTCAAPQAVAGVLFQ